MKKSLLLLVCFALFLVFSCETTPNERPLSVFADPCEAVSPTPDSLKYYADYHMPIVDFPNTSNPVFYSEEVVDIEWSLPEGLFNSELQIIELSNPYGCYDYEKFHLLNNYPSVGYGNQFVHRYFVNQLNVPITDTIFVAYRLRATDIDFNKKYSLWTHVNTFTIVPLSNLKKEVISVSYNFSFTTEELNKDYYSGILKKDNYKLIDIVSDNGLDYNKIRYVKPTKFETNFLTKKEDGSIPFSRLMLGFNEDFEYNSEFYPFEVFV